MKTELTKRFWYNLYENGQWVCSTQSRYYAEHLQKLWNCDLVIKYKTVTTKISCVIGLACKNYTLIQRC